MNNIMMDGLAFCFVIHCQEGSKRKNKARWSKLPVIKKEVKWPVSGPEFQVDMRMKIWCASLAWHFSIS